jgi:hypothetical protein
MTTTEAINALRIASAARMTTDKVERRKANKAFKSAALSLWAAWHAEGYPDAASEVLRAYGICFA